MPQDMSFAQALTEAKQIIVQQSARIKADLEKIKSLQDTVTSLSKSLSENDRTIKDQSSQLSEQSGRIESLTVSLSETTIAREQAEAINDRQGERLRQLQATLTESEEQVVELKDRVATLSQEIESVKGQLPTAEDEEALAALSNLLQTKKAGAPAVSSGHSMRIAGESSEIAKAA